MNTIHLDPAMVPAGLRGAYTGKTFKARVCEQMTIPMTAGLWDGGSRDTYRVVRLEDGATIEPVNHNDAPWNGERREVQIKLEPGIAVVEHTIFCGKDMGLTFYVHPDNAAKLLPAPVELSAYEAIVLNATASYKSSYNGRDRYDMAKDDYLYRNLNSVAPNQLYPTRQEWDAAKQSLISRGLLNKAGAITNAGRNARPSRY